MAQGQGRHPDFIRAIEARALRQQGLSLKAVADRMNTHKRQVLRWMSYDLQKYRQFAPIMAGTVIHRQGKTRLAE